MGHLSQKFPYCSGSSHTHLSHTHLPRPLHSKPSGDWQTDVEVEQPQLSPVHPSSHTHSPDTHTPRPEREKQKRRRKQEAEVFLCPLIRFQCVCLLTTAQQFSVVRAGEVVYLAVFPVYHPKPALVADTFSTFTHSLTAAVHVRPFCSAAPVRVCL